MSPGEFLAFPVAFGQYAVSPEGLPAYVLLSWLPWGHPYFRKQSDSVRVEQLTDEGIT